MSQHGGPMGAKAAELLIERLEKAVAPENKYRTEIMTPVSLKEVLKTRIDTK